MKIVVGGDRRVVSVQSRHFRAVLTGQDDRSFILAVAPQFLTCAFLAAMRAKVRTLTNAS